MDDGAAKRSSVEASAAGAEVRSQRAAGAHLSFLGRRLDPAFRVRWVAVAPGAERTSDETVWRDALVVVERGAVELECGSGARATFVPGDVFCVSRLQLRTLRNPAGVPALLSVVSRRPGVTSLG